MEQVRSLLKELNLDGKDYEEKLADQGFDSLAALCVSTEADLLECGLKKGHVRLLLKALATQTSGEKGKRDAGAVVANALQATKEEDCEEPRPPPVRHELGAAPGGVLETSSVVTASSTEEGEAANKLQRERESVHELVSVRDAKAQRVAGLEKQVQELRAMRAREEEKRAVEARQQVEREEEERLVARRAMEAERKKREQLEADELLVMFLQQEEQNRLIQEQADEAAAKALNFECPICCDSYSVEYIFRWGKCTHGTCRDCAHDHISHSMENSQLPVKCPSCDQKNPNVLHNNRVFEVLNSDERALFLQKERHLLGKTLENLHQCVTPDCKGMAQMENGVTHFICPVCSDQWCTRCEAKWHDGITCGQYNEWKRENAQADNLTDALIAGGGAFQRCPRCKNGCERIDGCAKLTCPQCNINFCLRCGKDITAEGYNHFGGTCRLWE